LAKKIADRVDSGKRRRVKREAKQRRENIARAEEEKESQSKLERSSDICLQHEEVTWGRAQPGAERIVLE
jgi:hypothetical protein